MTRSLLGFAFHAETEKKISGFLAGLLNTSALLCRAPGAQRNAPAHFSDGFYLFRDY